MRITAGLYRSRLLKAPPGTATRPTADRLRESLYNILSSRFVPHGGFTGLRVADLFAGTGALGLEALSRGAAHCAFAETAAPALQALRSNLGSLGVPSGAFTVNERGASPLLRDLARSGQMLDLVLLDPSYDDQSAYLSTLGALAPLLAPGAVVVAEFSRRGFEPPERVGPLFRTRLYPHGSSALAFYDREAVD